MCVPVFVCVFPCLYLCMCVSTCVSVHGYTCVSLCLCVMCVFPCLYLCMCVSACVCVCGYLCVCVLGCVCVVCVCPCVSVCCACARPLVGPPPHCSVCFSSRQHVLMLEDWSQHGCGVAPLWGASVSRESAGAAPDLGKTLSVHEPWRQGTVGFKVGPSRPSVLCITGRPE